VYQTKQTMDLQKIRPTHSQWRAPTASVTEGRIRTASAPGPLCNAAKKLAHPPKGKGGPLWQKFFDNARATDHPEPEKLADSLLRARERAEAIMAAQHKTLVTDKVPKPQETVVAAATVAKKGRVLPPDAYRCQAKTLAGKQCPFKATCMGFCSKHQVVGEPPRKPVQNKNL
jgi:hypothetical protein